VDVIAVHRRTSLPDCRPCIAGRQDPPVASMPPGHCPVARRHPTADQEKPIDCRPGPVGDTGSEVATTSSRRHHAEHARSARDHLVRWFFQNSEINRSKVPNILHLPVLCPKSSYSNVEMMFQIGRAIKDQHFKHKTSCMYSEYLYIKFTLDSTKEKSVLMSTLAETF
jgi:hypothetical protein